MSENRTLSEIRQVISKNDVVLFMKGTPDFPQCGFSSQISQILEHLGVPYEAVNILGDDALRQGIKDFTDWPTIPQLYVKGEFAGGADIVREMFENRELRAFFEEKGIALREEEI